MTAASPPRAKRFEFRRPTQSGPQIPPILFLTVTLAVGLETDETNGVERIPGLHDRHRFPAGIVARSPSRSTLPA